MSLAGSAALLAIAGLDPGGIIGGLLCLCLVAFIALMTGRKGGRRRPAGAPIHRRNPSYRRRLRREADSDWDDSGGSPHSHDSGDSGGGCGGGGGGGD